MKCFPVIFLLILIFPSCIRGQIPVVRNLVFEGGGIRGIAYSGAVRGLEERGLLQQVQRFGGTSAGAITALLLSLGYSAKEMTSIVGNTSFEKFNDGKFFLFGGINRVKKYYGWYRGIRFEEWLEKIIRQKTANPNISFAEMHARGFKDLYVTGTCLNKQSLVVFSYETYPLMKIKDAVRISMSIPFYFEAVFVNASGTIFFHPKNKTGLDVFADGGFIANFPIRIFDSTRYVHPEQRNSYTSNFETLGFRIDRQEQIDYDTSGKGLAEIPIVSVNDYVLAFYNMILESLNRQTLTSEDWKRTVSISDGNISPRIRKLQKEEINILVDNGYSATKYFLDHHLTSDKKK
ncbi:MAG: patatin-like phospholipase family protein [Flavisolibacter sp.]